jgi:hypothetical protein
MYSQLRDTTLADKKWFLDLDDLRRQESKSVWGWRVLMLGILVEIGTGAALTWHDVSENMKAASQIEKNDPRNQPIKSVEAHVFLSVFSTNGFADDFPSLHINPPLNSSGLQAEVLIEGKDGHVLWFLPCKEFSTNSQGPNRMLYSMEFGWPAPDFRSGEQFNVNSEIEQHAVSINKVDEQEVRVRINVPYLLDGSEIEDGSCVVMFGQFERRFLIPRIYEKASEGRAKWFLITTNNP